MNSRAPIVALALVALAASAASTAAAPPQDRFSRALETLAKAKGVAAHIALAEAQVLLLRHETGPARLAPVLDRLARRSRVPWLRGEALGAWAVLSLYAGKPAADIRELVHRAGVIDRGAVLGPLPGPGGGAEPPPYPLEVAIEGKVSPVDWRPFEGATVGGALRLDDLLGPTGDAHAFVRVPLTASRATDVMVVVSSNGPVAAWLDGVSVVTWDGDRSLSDWQHAVPVRLEAGAHRLVLRFGHRSRSPEAIVRVVDARGLLPDTVTIGGAAAAKVAGWKPSKALPPAVLDLPGTAAERGHVRLLVTPDAHGLRAAAEAFEAAIAADPLNAELHYLLGRADAADPSRAFAAFTRALELSNGAHAEALAELVDLAQRQGLDATADGYARALTALQPDHPTAVAHRALRVAALAGPAAAAAPLLSDPRASLHPRLASTLASLQEGAGRLRAAARLWATTSRASGLHLEALDSAVTLARRVGIHDEALRWLDQAMKLRPYALELYLLKARVVANTEPGAAAAIKVLAEIRHHHPDSPDLIEATGRFKLLAGDRPGGVAAFDRALELQPQNRALAEYRRTLTAGQTLAAEIAEPIDALIADGAGPPEGPEGGVYLLDKHAVRVFDSGLSRHFRQQLIRVDSERAAERFEQMVFPFTPGEDRVEILEAVVIHHDGTRSRPQAVFDHRPSGKQSGVYSLRAMKVVRFPSLVAGDVIHIQLRQDEVGDRNMFGDFFGVVLPLQSDLPKARVEVIVEAPAQRSLYAKSKGAPAPTRATDEAAGRQTVAWTLRDVAPISVEPQMPGYGDVGGYISVSTFADWNALVSWYRDLIRPQLELSPALEQTAASLVEGIEGTRERVAAVLRWVLKNTRYVGIEFGIHGFKPYRVTDVVKRGYGDCKDKASLLIAMLRSVGVGAEFVLVRTRDLGALEETPATLWAFNHAIAYVPELDVYIDGTSEYSGLDELPQLDQGAMVLRFDVRGDGAPTLTRIPISEASANRVTTQTVYKLTDSGDAAATFIETVAGTDAPGLRRRLQDASRRDEQLAEIIASQHAGATVTRTAYAHLDTLGEPVRIEVDATLPGFARRDGRVLQVPIALDSSNLLERYGSLDRRTQALVIDHPFEEVETAEVHVPPGASVATLPAPVDITSPFGRVRLTVAAAAHGFDFELRSELFAAQVMPGDYPAFRAFLEQVAAVQRTRVDVTLAD